LVQTTSGTGGADALDINAAAELAMATGRSATIVADTCFAPASPLACCD
jgi:hypothetical protein